MRHRPGRRFRREIRAGTGVYLNHYLDTHTSSCPDFPTERETRQRRALREALGMTPRALDTAYLSGKGGSPIERTDNGLVARLSPLASIEIS